MIRPAEERDLPDILALASAAFTKVEVACVHELLDASLHEPGQRDYLFLCYVDGDQVVGFACYGPTPLTAATFSLYWICVGRAYREHGVGSALVAEIEAQIARQGGNLLLVETSSTPQYSAARRFYSQHGFKRLARVRDFYAAGDDMIMYGKRSLGPEGEDIGGTRTWTIPRPGVHL
jgi:ribosomal protein S18 acetylase RimI-like enzyme